MTLVGTLVLNDALKEIFQRPRPGFDWAEVWPETGFPSGHATNSFVTYVALALVVWRVGGRRVGTVALALAVLLAVGIGISRICLGAHWLSDVIGGYLAEVLWLLSLVAASAVVSPLLRERALRRRGRGWGSAARTVPTRSVTVIGPERRRSRTLGRILEDDRGRSQVLSVRTRRERSSARDADPARPLGQGAPLGRA